MIITEKKLMSECGTCLVLNDGIDTNGKLIQSEVYKVEFLEMKYLIVEVGAKVGSGLANLKHSNILTSVKRIYEFKHYRKNGGKYWTSSAGISHFVIVPTDKIYLLSEKGYSYVKAEINGVKVMFNVSGGGGSNGWTDYVHSSTNISVGHKAKDIKKLLEVCVRDAEFETKFEIKQLEADQVEKWERMNEQASNLVKKQKEKIYNLIREKKPVTVILNDGYKVKEASVVGIQSCRPKKIKLSDTSFQYDYKGGAIKSLQITCEGYCYPMTLKVGQINWVATCKKIFEKV